MLIEERHHKIAEILHNRSSITISELEKMFNVSAETVRRDLLALESKKQLIRVHGGAMSIDNNHPHKSFDVRHTEYIKEKNELAGYAVSFIQEGDIIAVDHGSTAVIFCELLCQSFKNLTIIINSIMLFNILSKNKGFRIILCAGEYDRDSESFFGALTINCLEKLHIQKSFLCPSALSLKHGLTEFTESTIKIHQALKKNSDKCFIMADSSKFEVGGLYTTLQLTPDMTLITDSGLSDEIFHRYNNADIDIVRG